MLGVGLLQQKVTFYFPHNRALLLLSSDGPTGDAACQ